MAEWQWVSWATASASRFVHSVGSTQIRRALSHPEACNLGRLPHASQDVDDHQLRRIRSHVGPSGGIWRDASALGADGEPLLMWVRIPPRALRELRGLQSGPSGDELYQPIATRSGRAERLLGVRVPPRPQRTESRAGASVLARTDERRGVPRSGTQSARAGGRGDALERVRERRELAATERLREVARDAGEVRRRGATERVPPARREHRELTALVLEPIDRARPRSDRRGDGA